MNPIDIFIITLYYHFFQMQKRGRRVIPWFQTAFVIALFVTMTLVLLFRLFYVEAFRSISEWMSISLFMLMGLIWFFILKKFYFERGKHITLTEIYLSKYSSKRRALYKILAIGLCLFVPLLVGFFIWYYARIT